MISVVTDLRETSLEEGQMCTKIVRLSVVWPLHQELICSFILLALKCRKDALDTGLLVQVADQQRNPNPSSEAIKLVEFQADQDLRRVGWGRGAQ